MPVSHPTPLCPGPSLARDTSGAMQKQEFLEACLSSLQKSTGAPSGRAGSGGQPALDGVQERDEDQGSLDLTSVMELANFVMCGAGAEGEDVVEAALGVLDRGDVQHVVTEKTGRECHVVTGNRNTEYVCLGNNYCSCQSFLFAQRNSLGPISCKHLMALRIAPALKKVRRKTVHEQEFFNIVASR